MRTALIAIVTLLFAMPAPADWATCDFQGRDSGAICYAKIKGRWVHAQLPATPRHIAP